MANDPAVTSFPVPPIRKSVRVRLDVEEAFRRFTEEIGQWWPVVTHSVSRSSASTCFIEGCLGGRIVERDTEGNEYRWGRIEAWSPPHELAVRWHAGRNESEAQHLLVRFEEAAVGETEIRLVHSGWETLGAAASGVQRSYDSGWDVVLARFLAHTETGT